MDKDWMKNEKLQKNWRNEQSGRTKPNVLPERLLFLPSQLPRDEDSQTSQRVSARAQIGTGNQETEKKAGEARRQREAEEGK
jgi:hypothetical protein